MSLTLADAARARRTKRWHMLSVSEECSLASHSFMVAMIAESLVNEVAPNTSENIRYHLLKYCLIHDLDETVLGDWPGHVKAYLKDNYPDVKSVFDRLSVEVNPMAQKHLRELPEHLLLLIEIADKLEALFFIETFGRDPKQEQSAASLNEIIERTTIRGRHCFSQFNWQGVATVKRELYGDSLTFRGGSVYG